MKVAKGVLEGVAAVVVVAFGLLMFFASGGNASWINPGV